MDTLDLSSVTQKFLGLSHLTEEEAQIYAPTVKSAKNYFERLLKRYPNESEKELCEYACACKAFFDYTILCAATAKTYSTQSGGVYARVAENEAVNNAEKLMRNAMSSLPCDLISDDGFVFEGVDS